MRKKLVINVTLLLENANCCSILCHLNRDIRISSFFSVFRTLSTRNSIRNILLHMSQIKHVGNYLSKNCGCRFSGRLAVLLYSPVSRIYACLSIFRALISRNFKNNFFFFIIIIIICDSLRRFLFTISGEEYSEKEENLAILLTL